MKYSSYKIPNNNTVCDKNYYRVAPINVVYPTSNSHLKSASYINYLA